MGAQLDSWVQVVPEFLPGRIAAAGQHDIFAMEGFFAIRSIRFNPNHGTAVVGHEASQSMFQAQVDVASGDKLLVDRPEGVEN